MLVLEAGRVTHFGSAADVMKAMQQRPAAATSPGAAGGARVLDMLQTMRVAPGAHAAEKAS
jgi:hypothetical protein